MKFFISAYKDIQDIEFLELLVKNRGNVVKKSGKYLIKSGNREIVRRLIFFPASAPASHCRFLLIVQLAISICFHVIDLLMV